VLLGFGSNFKTDRTFWDKAEEIPGGYIIQREIEKAVSGKPFFYNNEDGKPVRLQGLDFNEFYYYYLIWEDWHVLKVLPHGKGTLSERRWVIDLVKICERTYDQIELLKDEQLARKMKVSNG
jgi:hypothetical protein